MSAVNTKLLQAREGETLDGCILLKVCVDLNHQMLKYIYEGRIARDQVLRPAPSLDTLRKKYGIKI